MACPSAYHKSRNIRQSENTLEDALMYVENIETSRRTIVVKWIKLLKSYFALLNVPCTRRKFAKSVVVFRSRGEELYLLRIFHIIFAFSISSQ
jgi:hypothetical protein